MYNNTTIGMDLGNKVHKIIGLNEHGKEVLRCEVENTKAAVEAFFKEHADATIAMETGTCCRWVSKLARLHCHDAIVGNARKLRAIWQSKQKNDWNDAHMIAALARASRELFHPVMLRDDEHHDLYQLIQLRDISVRQRTQTINAIRGMCKAAGDFVRKCDAQGLFRHLEYIPETQAWKFRPLIERLGAIAENIQQYDWLIQDYADAHFKTQVALLRTIPGVGLITSCMFVALIQDPKNFGNPRDAGCYFGLTAGQDQSGDKDAPMHVTKAGNTQMRKLLVTAANYILRDSSPDSAIKRYGQRICARGGKIARRKAKIAIARKLSVVMMSMLQSGESYRDERVSNEPKSTSPGLIAI